MKTYILTEKQVKKIIDNILSENINEQSTEKRQMKAIQMFLNKKFEQWKNEKKIKDFVPLVEDGLFGEKTKEYIRLYQKNIGVYPTDGVWGANTQKLMPIEDRKMYDVCVKKTGDIIDKMLNLF